VTTGRKRYGIIGTGHRASMFIDALTTAHADDGEIVAWSDSNPGRIDFYEAQLKQQGVAAPIRFAPHELERAIAEHRLDSLIIVTPDATHPELISRSLGAGADAIVEKPIAIDVGGCTRILEAVEKTGRDVRITFNYRYAPRNSALKQVIASGELGQITSVTFEWVLDLRHGADYFRRWHRNKHVSGGLFVHKASHHFDLVNWWLADVPTAVFARGRLGFYGPENAASRGLGARPARGTSDAGVGDPFSLDLREDPRLAALYLDAEKHDGYLRDQDVFTGAISIEDNMAAIVTYRGGPILSYALNAHSPWEGYSVAVNGTAGRAELTVVERGAVLLDGRGRPVLDPSWESADEVDDGRPMGETLIVQPHFSRARRETIPAGGGAHGGGDGLMLADLFRDARVDPLARASGFRDGIRAASVGIAANHSMQTGAAVAIKEIGLDV
jgi:predicted dehydrogenase